MNFYRIEMIKNSIKYLFISSVAIQFSSCDCSQHAKGTVLDKATKMPIDSVYVHKVGQEIGGYSDSDGSFKLSAIDGGVFGCPIMEVVFIKKGYKTVSEKVSDSENEIIYLEKNNR